MDQKRTPGRPTKGTKSYGAVRTIQKLGRYQMTWWPLVLGFPRSIQIEKLLQTNSLQFQPTEWFAIHLNSDLRLWLNKVNLDRDASEWSSRSIDDVITIWENFLTQNYTIPNEPFLRFHHQSDKPKLISRFAWEKTPQLTRRLKDSSKREVWRNSEDAEDWRFFWRKNNFGEKVMVFRFYNIALRNG